MTKKYKLLKSIDSPTVKCEKGAIGVMEGVTNHVWFNNYQFYYEKGTVLSQPEWFQEVVEDNAFVWDDDDAKGRYITELEERLRYCGELPPMFRKNFIDKFKASHTAKQSSPIPTTPTQPIVEEEKKEWWQKLGIKFDGKWYTHPKTNTYDNLDKVVIELSLANNSKLYTQEQMDKAIEDAFNAAREREETIFKTVPYQKLKYLYPKDYLNHLKQNK